MALTFQQLDSILNSVPARARCRVALILAAKDKSAELLPGNPSQADIDKYNGRKILARNIQLPGGVDNYVGKMAGAIMSVLASSPYLNLIGVDDSQLSEIERANVDTTLRNAFQAIYDTFIGT